MREFKLDYAFRPPAREAYDRLSEAHRADVDRRIDLLCTDPSVDGRTKFRWPGEGPERILYDDDAWELIYRLVDDDRVVEIWALSPVGWLRGID